MKKILLGSTALVAASMIAAPGAQASDPIKLGVGGWMIQGIGYADQDGSFEDATSTKYNGWDQKQRSEVHFKGSTKLDNGIAVSVKIELESDSNGDNFGIDENYMKLTSASLGSLYLGKYKGVGYTMRHGAPNNTGVTRDGGDVQTNAFIVGPGNVDNIATTSIGARQAASTSAARGRHHARARKGSGEALSKRE